MSNISDLKPKVSIIGAGNVGMRYAYALMIGGVVRQMVIVDLDRKKTEGEVMDLSHGAPYISPVEIISGDYADIKDSDLVVITAGKKQAQGQSRIDLAKDNARLYKTIISQVMRYAPSAIFLIVTNPVDVLSYAALKFSGKSYTEVIGSGTVLDSARFRTLLGRHCGIDPRNIHAYILGEHGDTEFAAWSNAMIGGVLLKEYCAACDDKHACDNEKGLNQIFEDVRDSAYKIIGLKGETSYGIGLALVRITQAIIKNENAILPVSSLTQGYLGVNDVYLSLPAVINKKGIREVLQLTLNAREQKEFRKSSAAIKRVIKELGLL